MNSQPENNFNIPKDEETKNDEKLESFILSKLSSLEEDIKGDPMLTNRSHGLFGSFNNKTTPIVFYLSQCSFFRTIEGVSNKLIADKANQLKQLDRMIDEIKIPKEIWEIQFKKIITDFSKELVDLMNKRNKNE